MAKAVPYFALARTHARTKIRKGPNHDKITFVSDT